MSSPKSIRFPTVGAGCAETGAGEDDAYKCKIIRMRHIYILEYQVIITLFNYSLYFIFLTCHIPGRMRVVTCFHWVMAPRVGLVVGQTGLFCIAQISRTAKTHYSSHHLFVKVHLKKPSTFFFHFK